MNSELSDLFRGLDDFTVIEHPAAINYGGSTAPPSVGEAFHVVQPARAERRSPATTLPIPRSPLVSLSQGGVRPAINPKQSNDRISHSHTTPRASSSSPGRQPPPKLDHESESGPSSPPAIPQNLKPELTRLREALECGDSKKAGDIVTGLLLSFAKGKSPKSTVVALFQNQLLSRSSIEYECIRAISVRENEFGSDHPRTTETRISFVYAFLEILEADGDGPAWDQEYARRMLEWARQLLCRILGPCFSQDVMKRLVPSASKGEEEGDADDADRTKAAGVSLWETYEFLESAILACVQNNFLVHAILSCMDYERIRSVYQVKQSIRQLIQKGLLTEHKNEEGNWVRTPTPAAAPFLKGKFPESNSGRSS